MRVRTGRLEPLKSMRLSYPTHRPSLFVLDPPVLVSRCHCLFGLHPHLHLGELRRSEHLRPSSPENRGHALRFLRPFAPDWQLLRPLLTSRSATRRRPFSHKARSPQVRTHTFTAQSPDLRHFALITRASRSFAHSPCSAAPSIRFLFIDSRFMLHASSPHSVALMQLRFTSFAVINLRRDFHPQACAHAGRTNKKARCNNGPFSWQSKVCQIRYRGSRPAGHWSR